MIGHRRGSPWRPVTVCNSVKNQVGNGGHAINPLPFRYLRSGRHLAAHVVLPLETDGKLLVFHVGTNVVHLDGVAHEVGPGPTDVEGGGVVANVFFHALSIAHPVRPRSLP